MATRLIAARSMLSSSRRCADARPFDRVADTNASAAQSETRPPSSPHEAKKRPPPRQSLIFFGEPLAGSRARSAPNSLTLPYTFPNIGELLALAFCNSGAAIRGGNE